MSNSENLATQVRTAFDAARDGDFGPSTELQQQGEKIVPLLEPYLRDTNENIRRQAVALLAIGGDKALPFYAIALSDASPDIRQRGAMALYERYHPATLATLPEIKQAVRACVTGDHHPAAAILLLGYFGDADSQQALVDLRTERADELTELQPWNPAVPVGLPADISLSRLGDGEARRRLMNRIETNKLDETIFLLHVLREIDSPEVLHILKAVAFEDQREIQGDLPAGAEPRPRLCDLAVNAFVKRLNLKVDFELSGHQRYTDATISTVRRSIDERLPQ